MSRVICFGEIMLRLNPEGYLKLIQASKLDMSFAGSEASVAVSLANFGIGTSFVTKLPENDLTKGLLRNLKSYSVDTSKVVLGGDRLGIYFVERGASQRPSKVTYDRKFSSIATSKASDFNWKEIFKGAEWFHFSGITPALSEDVATTCLEACKQAKDLGLTVSCDINYRKNLWDSSSANLVMSQLMRFVDVCIANEEDAEKVFGIKAQDSDIVNGKLNPEGYRKVAEQITKKFGCKKVAFTLRGSISASDNNWAAMLYDNGDCHFSRNYLVHIVDRLGGGDSFAAALIYSLLLAFKSQDAIEFAAAASCLKHTIEFDFNQVTVDEINQLVMGDGSGRVRR